MKKANCIKLLILGVVLVLLSSCKSKDDTSIDQIKTIPNICLRQYGGELFEMSQQACSRKTIVMFFSPDCELCEAEIDSICSHSKEYKDIKWLFITDSFFEDLLETFLIEHNLYVLDNSVILIENRHQYKELFQAFGTPATFVYDSKNRLIHYSRKAVDIKTLMDWIK